MSWQVIFFLLINTRSCLLAGLFLSIVINLPTTWASQLGLQNTQTASLQRGETSPNECPGYGSKQSYGEAPVMLGALGNAEYPFIAIAPRFQSGSEW